MQERVGIESYGHLRAKLHPPKIITHYINNDRGLNHMESFYIYQGHAIHRLYVGYINKIHSLQQGRDTLALQPCYKLGLGPSSKQTGYKSK